MRSEESGGCSQHSLAAVLRILNCVPLDGGDASRITLQELLDCRRRASETTLRCVFVLAAALCAHTHSGGSERRSEAQQTSAAASAPPTLSALLDATIRLTFAARQHKPLFTIGAHRGLAVRLAQLPFECLAASADVGWRCLTSLVLVSLDNPICLALLREHISPTWLASFIRVS